MADEILTGGRDGVILRHGDRVTRPAGRWSKAIHALLHHIRARGFDAAPLPYGFDDHGNEIVSFIEGTVSNYPLSDAARSQTALVTAARLLRAYHDAVADFDVSVIADSDWMLPPREPREVICHGDFAPYNVVLNGQTSTAIIDFDTAHPGPRRWDIAYALYRYAPFAVPGAVEGFAGLEEQIARGRLFLDAYGRDALRDTTIAALIAERLQALTDFMVAGAAKGNEAFIANLRDGHDQVYRRDRAHVLAHAKEIDMGLFGD